MADIEHDLGHGDERGDGDILAGVSVDDEARVRLEGIAASAPDVLDIKQLFEALKKTCIFCERPACRDKCTVERTFTYKDMSRQSPGWLPRIPFFCQVCDYDAHSHPGHNKDVRETSSCAAFEKITPGGGVSLGKL